MTDLKEIFGQNLARLRSEAGLTQAELGEELNYSDKTVSKWERGDSVPDVTVMKELAKRFDVTLDDLLTDPKERDKSFQAETKLQKKMKKAKVHRAVWSIVMVAYWAAVLLALFLIYVFTKVFFWKLLVFALPVCFILNIVFAGLWSKNKAAAQFVNVNCLVASVLSVLYVIFLSSNLWQLFLLMVPCLIITALSILIHKNK